MKQSRTILRVLSSRSEETVHSVIQPLPGSAVDVGACLPAGSIYLATQTDMKPFKGARRHITAVVIILVVLAGLLAEGVFLYNRFYRQLTVVNAKRAAINREFKRRANLMPNLVKVVSQYVVYEEDIAEYIADTGFYKFVSNLPNQQGKMLDMTNPHVDLLSEMLFGRQLSLMLFDEICYLNLKGTESVQNLMKEAANTENRVVEAKKEYNKACQVYNQYRLTLPGRLFGFIFGFNCVPYLGAEKETLEVPDIDLDIGPVEEIMVAPDLHLGVFKAMMPDTGKREELINTAAAAPQIAEGGADIIITAILMTLWTTEDPNFFLEEVGVDPF
jgi:LemA protein